jgi:Tfp pilus assembly protein PilX
VAAASIRISEVGSSFVKVESTIRKRRSEAGVALLISIFVLLLISIVAIALIVSSGTESALAGNYRSATAVYYAALAGLEEGRGRLLGKNTTSFKNTAAGFMPSAGVTLAMGSPRYVINPVSGETVAPWDPSNQYADTQYGVEFSSSSFSAPPNPSPSTSSLSTVAGIQGPLYKWVRINAVSQKSLGLGTDTTPLYYDGANLNTTSTGAQVFEITSFAVLPNGSQTNGSQKILQYIAAPVPISLPSFPGALTLAGDSTNGVVYTPPTSSSFYASGTDIAVPFCTTGPAVHAVGVFDDPPDKANVITGGNGGTGIPAAVRPQYTGLSSAPDVADVSSTFPANLQKPSQLDALAQIIIQNADVIITPSGGPPVPPVNGTSLSSSTSGMSSTNPMTVVINGDLDLTGWHNTGYGLLLVTGNLNYDPDASWQGIVLVIGQGTVTGSRSGSGEFDGAFLVAKTRDSTGALLADPNLGKASMIFASGMGGNGFRYSSCWIQRSQPTASYKILSFHEIAQ